MEYGIEKSVHEKFIKEGMTVCVRKCKIDRYSMVSLGEGKIRRASDNIISIFLPFMENKVGNADIIKVFWEDELYYYSGVASSFHPLCEKEFFSRSHLMFEILMLEGFDNIYYIDKRKDVRVPYNLKIDYIVITKTKTKIKNKSKSILIPCNARIQTGIAENLSFGGMQFNTHEKLKLNDEIELSFDFPELGFYLIFTKARVVRISQSRCPKLPYKTAVRFTNLDPHDNRLIAEFILEKISN